MSANILKLCSRSTRSALQLIKTVSYQTQCLRNTSIRQQGLFLPSHTCKRWLTTPSRTFLQKKTDGKDKPKAKKQEKPPPKGVSYKKLSLGVPKERWENERRVSISPQVVSQLVKKGFTVKVEDGAGALAQFRNEDYTAAGATIVKQAEAYNTGKIYGLLLFFSFYTYIIRSYLI